MFTTMICDFISKRLTNLMSPLFDSPGILKMTSATKTVRQICDFVIDCRIQAMTRLLVFTLD